MSTLLYHWDFSSNEIITNALNNIVYDKELNLQAKIISRNDISTSTASRNKHGIQLNNNDTTGGICIDLLGLDIVQLGGNITIEMVIKNLDTSRNVMYFQTIRDDVENNNDSAFISFKYDDTPKLLVRTNSVSEVGYNWRKAYVSTPEINNTDFFHYVFTISYDSHVSSLKICVNGLEKAEQTANLSEVLNNTFRQSNLIGTQKNSTGATYLNGTVKYIKIYQNAMNVSDIETLYKNYLQSGNICFLGNAKVQTDQGKIRFDKLSVLNTIDGIQIKQVVKVVNYDNTLIFIYKNALGKNYPNKNMYISKNHGIYLDTDFINCNKLQATNNIVRARDLVKLHKVVEITRQRKDIIYNVLLSFHGKMMVNGLICETLNPVDSVYFL